MPSPHLSAYLNDHLAGAVAALEMIAHLQSAHADILDPDTLGRVEEEVEADRATLESLMERLGITQSRTRRAAGWLAERASRLKLAVDDPKDGALRAFETIEIVSLGIEGKISLWQSLAAAASSDPVLSGVDYDALIARARDQRRTVETLHADAARTALVDRHGA
ncbi:MAG TPA: hypothetical protein VGM82_12990 [Gemmatimonadaceae bacterium]|jgi:hypothetical protein